MSMERVNQLWPSDLKQALLTHVGKRGMTSFTVKAVQEKLEREKEQPDETPSQVDDAPTPQVEQPDEAQAVVGSAATIEARVDAVVHEVITERVEVPPVAINPIPAAVVEIPEPTPEETAAAECDICKTTLEENGYCWLCGQYR